MVLRNDVNEKFVKALETYLTIPNGQLKMEFDHIGNDFCDLWFVWNRTLGWNGLMLIMVFDIWNVSYVFIF